MRFFHLLRSGDRNQKRREPKRSTVIAIAVLGGLAFAHFSAAADFFSEGCAQYFRPFAENFHGNLVTGYRTKVLWPKDKPFFSQLVENPNSVFLTIEEPHHYSIRIGDHAFHGQVMKLPRMEQGLESDVAPNGLVIRLENLAEETYNRIHEEAMRSQGFLSFSCVHYACYRLDKAGVSIRELKERGEPPIYLSNTLEAILRNGFVGPDGAPVESTILYNGKGSLTDLNHRLRSYDQRLEKINESRFRKSKGVDLAALGPVDPEVLALILNSAESKGLKVAGGEVPEAVDPAGTAAGIALIVIVPRSDRLPSIPMPPPEPAQEGAAP